VIGVYYPQLVSNSTLYEGCKTTELEHTIREARWRILGHVLRMSDEIPAKKTIKRYFDQGSRSFLGRPRTTLATVIDQDLKLAAAQPINLGLPEQLKDQSDLEQLEMHASDRKKWKSIVTNMHAFKWPKTIIRKLRTRERQAIIIIIIIIIMFVLKRNSS
jgi:hypothetical protein